MGFHAGFAAFAGGSVGVDVFFVVSGLVTRLILGEGEHFSLVRFYERRARRILPALFVVLAASLAAAWWWFLPADLLAFSRSLAAVLGLSSNLYFWRTALDYFARPTDLVPLLHTWSLAVEEQYYLLFPLGVMVLRRLAPGAIGRRLPPALASPGPGALGHDTRADGGLSCCRPALGAAPRRVARLRHDTSGAVRGHHMAGAREPAGRRRPRAHRRGGRVWPRPVPGLAALVPTVGTALVIALPGRRRRRPRAQPPRARGLGLISYSAYLWHQPLLAFARL
jgi:peptidoglycan/LPS O-acetylase OafA/YrhL